MRFGVILYSAKLVETIEANDGELPVAHLKDDREDISSLVIYLAYKAQISWYFIIFLLCLQ